MQARFLGQLLNFLFFYFFKEQFLNQRDTKKKKKYLKLRLGVHKRMEWNDHKRMKWNEMYLRNEKE